MSGAGDMARSERQKWLHLPIPTLIFDFHRSSQKKSLLEIPFLCIDVVKIIDSQNQMILGKNSSFINYQLCDVGKVAKFSVSRL